MVTVLSRYRNIQPSKMKVINDSGVKVDHSIELHNRVDLMMSMLIMLIQLPLTTVGKFCRFISKMTIDEN